MRIAVVAQSPTATNDALVRAGSGRAAWCALTPGEALERLEPGDCAIGRIDVLPTVDGVDEGLWALGTLEARGVTVLNGAPSLLAAHDKLLTARLLRTNGLPHPRTRLLTGDRPVSTLRPPVVIKPRFGSWGLGVERCDDDESLARIVSGLPDEPWYRAHGALVQDLVPPCGFDLRIVVAANHPIGAISRVARPGEWRTNVALGAKRRRVTPSPRAIALALAAARATSAALVGVDLLPDGNGRLDGCRDQRSRRVQRPVRPARGARPVRRHRLAPVPGRDLSYAGRACAGGRGCSALLEWGTRSAA